MKRTLGFLLLFMSFSSLLFGQTPHLQRFVNGVNIGTSVPTIQNTKRISLRIDEPVQQAVGTVYEFGAIYAYRNVGGQRQLIKKFRDSEVMNGPAMNFAIGAYYHPDLMGVVEFEIEWVKRYDLNNNVEILPLLPEEKIFTLDIQN